MKDKCLVIFRLVGIGLLYIMLFGGMICIPGSFIYCIALGGFPWYVVPFMLAFALFYVVVPIGAHYHFLGEYALARVVMREDHIKWSCIGFRSVTMRYTDIKYIGIATHDEKDDESLLYTKDEVFDHYFSTWIYVSYAPVSFAYLHRIHKMRPRDGFFKMPYSMKFAEALLSHVPSEKAASLQFFHNTILLADKKDHIKSEKRTKSDQ